MQLVFMIFVSSFGLTYFLLEKSGLFTYSPSSISEVLYSIPILSASVTLLLVTLGFSFKNIRRLKVKSWLPVISLVLCICGLWLSYLTRFSGEVVLTEGQTFYSGHKEYLPQTLYKGRYATVPDIGIKLTRLIPTFSSDGNSIDGLKGDIQVYIKNKEPRDTSLTDSFPKLIGGSWFSIDDFGYSPRFVLKNDKNRVLDNTFIYLKLFPSGSEDYFRLLSPITYYVRYFPSGKDDEKEPIINLRIVRNKDLDFNDGIRISQEVPFENNTIHVEEVRTWTKLSIKRGWGEVLFFIGLLPALFYIVIVILKKPAGRQLE